METGDRLNVVITPWRQQSVWWLSTSDSDMNAGHHCASLQHATCPFFRRHDFIEGCSIAFVHPRMREEGESMSWKKTLTSPKRGRVRRTRGRVHLESLYWMMEVWLGATRSDSKRTRANVWGQTLAVKVRDAGDVVTRVKYARWTDASPKRRRAADVTLFFYTMMPGVGSRVQTAP